MRKEIYKVKCPQHIVFGDPMYFERFRGNELNRLTVDYRPSKYFDTARLVLKEEPNRELSEYMNRSITLYAAPRQTIDVYACEQIYTCLLYTSEPCNRGVCSGICMEPVE